MQWEGRSMSFTDLVHATKTALSSDPAQAQAKFEAHHNLEFSAS
jgi:hypothetical protein